VTKSFVKSEKTYYYILFCSRYAKPHTRAYINMILYIVMYDKRDSDRAQTSVKGKFQLSGKIRRSSKMYRHIRIILLYWSWLGEEAGRNYNCVLYASDVGGGGCGIGIPDVCWKSKVKRTHIIPSMLYYTFIQMEYLRIEIMHQMSEYPMLNNGHEISDEHQYYILI